MTDRGRKWLFFIALPIVIGLAAWQVRLETDLSAFFIAGTSEEEAFLANAVQSGELSRRYLISIGRKDRSRAGLAPFADRLLDALETLEGTAGAWHANRLPVDPTGLAKLYARHFARLYSLQPERDAPRIFSPEQLDRRAAALKEALLSPQGRLLKTVVREDPLLLSLESFKQWGQNFGHGAEGEGSFVNLILESRADGLDADAQALLQRSMESRLDALNGEYSDAFTLEYTGVPVFAVAAQRQIQGDIAVVSLVSSVAVVLLFLWIFRSLSAMHWVFLILVSSFAAAALVTQWLFGQVHGLTLALGATLLGVCIDYPIHTLAHAGATKPDRRRLAIARIWPSLLLGGATTVIGYLALGLTGYPGFRQIAAFAGTGIVTALLLTRYVLPALIGDSRAHWPRWRLLSAWIDFCRRRRRLLLIVVTGAGLASLACLPRLAWLEDLEKLTAGLEDLRERDRTIRSRLPSVEPGRFVLVSAGDTELALQRGEAVYAVLDALQERGELVAYFGLYPWLISEQLQKRNLDAYSRQLAQAGTGAWRTALAREGLSASKLGDLDPSAPEPLTVGDVLDSPVQNLISGQLIRAKDKTLAVIWLGRHRPAALRTALEDVEGASYFSQRDMLNRLAQRYQTRAVVTLLAGLAAIYLLLLLRYRRPGPALQALAPALLACLFILAAWALAGLPVSFLHIVGFLLATAICVDYGIFFLENRAHDAALTYQAMGASMLTTLAAFGALALAENATLKSLSGAVSTGVLIGYLLCPLLIGTSRRPGT